MRLFVNILGVGLALLLVGLVGCSRTIEEFDPPSYAYFPLETGKYKVYSVDSTVYDEYNCTVSTSNFQIKEVTGNTVLDGENQLAYKVERYKRQNPSLPWNPVGVWIEKIADQQVQRVEENQRLIPLVFPIKENQKWDGIVFIRRDTLVPIQGGVIDMYKDWDDFRLVEIDVPYVDPTTLLSYAQTTLVLQADKENNIERRYSMERYAKGVGLIYKEMRILDSQCRVDGSGNINCAGVGDIVQCLGKPWVDKAEKGFILQQRLIEHNY